MVTLSHAATASGGDYQDLADGGNGTVTTVDTGHGATGAPTSVSVNHGDDIETCTIVLHSQRGGTVTITPASSAVGTATVSGAEVEDHRLVRRLLQPDAGQAPPLPPHTAYPPSPDH
ncbi:MAG: hypothetical protein OXF67_07750 [Cyanobacteria bacterium MAG CAR4_bin_6]|nr:hypothetical protein [Cyanobacteria bacterium MAG CAR4_bin_6]